MPCASPEKRPATSSALSYVYPEVRKRASEVSPCSLRQVPPRTACVAGCQLCVLLRSKPVVFFIILSVQNRNNRIAQCRRSHLAPQIGPATTIDEYLRDRRLDPRRARPVPARMAQQHRERPTQHTRPEHRRVERER